MTDAFAVHSDPKGELQTHEPKGEIYIKTGQNTAAFGFKKKGVVTEDYEPTQPALVVVENTAAGQRVIYHWSWFNMSKGKQPGTNKMIGGDPEKSRDVRFRPKPSSLLAALQDPSTNWGELQKSHAVVENLGLPMKDEKNKGVWDHGNTIKVMPVESAKPEMKDHS